MNPVIGILMATNFVIGMGGFMVVGLLLPVAEDLSLSDAGAGWMMTSYALGYAVLSPLLVSATGAVGRRRILAIGVCVFALAALICALAPGPSVLFAARVLAAAGAGIVTPVAASVAAGLSPPDRQARALALVFSGMTLAQVIGVPAGGWIAYTFGWRTAFLTVAVLALPTIWLIWTRVPAGLSFAPVSLTDLGRVLRNGTQMLAVGFTAVLMGAIYIVYTYLGPLLNDTFGYGRDGIAIALIVFGVGAVLGNLAGGAVTDRIGPSRTLTILCLSQMVIMPAFSALPVAESVLMALLLLWALFGFSFMSAQQVRLISLDPAQAPVFLALNAAAIYVGAAVGSAIGGAVILEFGLLYLGVSAGVVALAALGVLMLADRLLARST